jgi:TetR/AcrR family transcriptional regulator, regulator of autoinduction and epiphytic fitness
MNSTASFDGRSARRLRTYEAVVDAMLALIDEGNLRPTAKQVSERAGVSLRSVFQHFNDLEMLYATAADHQAQRLGHLMKPIPADGTFEERLRVFVETRTSVLEAISPVRRAGLLQVPFSHAIASRMKWVRRAAREESDRVFAQELAALPKDERRETANAVHIASEWYTWESLRTHDNLSPEDARKVIARMIRALLRKETP